MRHWAWGGGGWVGGRGGGGGLGRVGVTQHVMHHLIFTEYQTDHDCSIYGIIHYLHFEASWQGTRCHTSHDVVLDQ